MSPLFERWSRLLCKMFFRLINGYDPGMGGRTQAFDSYLEWPDLVCGKRGHSVNYNCHLCNVLLHEITLLLQLLLPVLLIWILFNKNSLTFVILWDLFCVLGTLDMCFQIITDLVSDRRNLLAYCFIFVLLSFKARNFFLISLLNLQFLFGILSVTKHLPLCNRKIQPKFVETYKSPLIFTKQNLQYMSTNTVFICLLSLC
jgi:hypothetical protein